MVSRQPVFFYAARGGKHYRIIGLRGVGSPLPSTLGLNQPLLSRQFVRITGLPAISFVSPSLPPNNWRGNLHIVLNSYVYVKLCWRQILPLLF